MSSTAQETMERWVDEQVAAGADLSDIIAALEAMDETAEVDDQGRPMIAEPEAEGRTRKYFNIRDRANGDPIAAKNLAQWALNRYRKSLAKIAEVNAVAAQQMAQIEAWRDAEAKKIERDSQFFAGVLDQYREDFAPDERSVALIGGKLKLTKNRARISWQDDQAREWALTQPNVDDLCPRSLSKAAVKSLLERRKDGSYVLAETGEVVDFVCDVEPADRDSFSVELD